MKLVLVVTSLLVAFSAMGLVLNIKNAAKSEYPGLSIGVALFFHTLVISGILYLGAV